MESESGDRLCRPTLTCYAGNWMPFRAPAHYSMTKGGIRLLSRLQQPMHLQAHARVRIQMRVNGPASKTAQGVRKETLTLGHRD